MFCEMSSLENPENPDEMQMDPPPQESSWANGQVPHGSDPLPDIDEPAAADQ